MIFDSVDSPELDMSIDKWTAGNGNCANQIENNYLILRFASIVTYIILFHETLTLNFTFVFFKAGLLYLFLRLIFFEESEQDVAFILLVSISTIQLVLSCSNLLENFRVCILDFMKQTYTRCTSIDNSENSYLTTYDVTNNVSNSLSTLLSICNMKKEPGYTEAYATKVWRRIPTDPKICTWISKAPSDGILFHTAGTFEATPEQMLTWISEEHTPSGLEHISFRYDNLFVSKNNDLFVKNFYLESGSMQATHRVLTVVSGSTRRDDGLIVLHSRSTNLPDRIDVKAREPHEPNGYIRALLYGSGFIIKSVQPSSDTSKPLTLVQFAIHLDLLGSVTGRANRYNREILLQSTQTLFDNLRSRCMDFNVFGDTSMQNGDAKVPRPVSGRQSGSSTPQKRLSTESADFPIILNLPVSIANVQARVVQLAEKRLQYTHTLLNELRAEQRAGFVTFYRTQLGASPVKEVKTTTKRTTWRSVTARKQLLSSSSSNGTRTRSRSPSPHVTPCRAATVEDPIELLLDRNNIKIWNHRHSFVLSAVMHVEVSHSFFFVFLL